MAFSFFSMQSTQAPKSSLRFLPLPVLSPVEGVEMTEALGSSKR